MDNIVVVDGAPVIDASKKERLVTKICKDFGKKGVHVKADNIFMPWDDKAGKSKGCVLAFAQPTTVPLRTKSLSLSTFQICFYRVPQS